MKRIRTLFLLAVLAVMCASLFSCSGEADTPAPFDGVAISVGGERIQITSRDGEHMLFVPSADCVWDISGGYITVDGVKVQDGDAVGLEGISEVSVATADGTYTVTVAVSDNVDAMFISIKNGSMDEVNASSDHSVSASGALSVISPDGKILYKGELAKIRGRGNATWGKAEKRPYQIELSKKTGLLGLAEAKKFVLLAEYYDPSTLRNAAAMTLADSASDSWAPDFTYVDLYADGEYLGLYVLCDKVDVSESKLDVTDLEKLTEGLLTKAPEEYPRGGALEGTLPGSAKWYELPRVPDDITGGYLLEVDYTNRYPAEASGFVTDRGLPVVIKSPEFASREQVEYIKDYFCAFEDALFSEDGTNSEGKHYSEYADVGSLAFRYLFEEFALNIDAGVASFYISKDADGKLDFSCVWDYDCAFGNYNKYADLTSPETLFVGESETRNSGLMPNLFYAALTHEDFRSEVVCLWQDELRDECTALSGRVTSLADELSASLACDDLLYPRVSRRDLYHADSGDTPDAAVEVLISFIERRAVYFDSVFNDNYLK